jgi:phosphoribosyl 1,2-cyclic phosphate phosphodiesterase
MKIKYLGTGASEGWPAVFCQCEPCRQARRLGGKNIRHRSSAVVNGNLLLDLSPDIYSQSLANDVDLSLIKSFLITHNHEDHFYAHELVNFTDPFAYQFDKIPARLYGSVSVVETTNLALTGRETDGVLEIIEVKAFQPFTAAGCTITPLPANHIAGVAFNYLIRSDGITLLYAHDTGWLLGEVWEYLKGRRLDLVSMDCTCSDEERYEYHMSPGENIAMKNQLIEMGCADECTVFVSAHFSHNGALMHEQIEAKLQPQGIVTAYDGLEVEA